MFTVQLLLFAFMFVCAPFIALASDAESTKSNKHLPMNVVLDSQGRPIQLPQEQSALDYSSKEASLPQRSKPKRSKTKAKQKPKRRATLAVTVANHPRCRWLNTRMSQLSQSAKQQGNQAYGYQHRELKQRNREWQCLRCEHQAPVQDDLDRCHHYR